MKKAICVGINDYAEPTSDLFGCINDADDWADLLSSSYAFDVTTMKDGQATRAGLMGALRALVCEMQEDDVGVLTFSGHGTWVPDNAANPDEADNRDEALCAHDGNILDDEIRVILNQLRDGARLTVISDTCHSGTVTRGRRAARLDADARRGAASTAPRLRFMPPSEESTMVAGMLPVRRRMFYPESHMSEVLLTGCNAVEYSYDAVFNGRFNGAMTWNAIRLIKANGDSSNLTYRQLHRKLREILPSVQYPQSPQLEGPDELKDRPLFS